ncbi:hypothetical protein ElyMa_003971100 [Elysia marginata]|uniref:GON domain-containing protein n=1 Tax=Elysia marginata TaxID=1093978 RepID=A0AAV4FWC6_9GAST|nr:hypothetical protein ElyMa_003971100 [Elysia marginata]
MRAGLSQFISRLSLIVALLVFLSIYSVSGFFRYHVSVGRSYPMFRDQDASHECRTLREIFSYENCPRHTCKRGRKARSHCCTVTQRGVFGTEETGCRCNISAHCLKNQHDRKKFPPSRRPPPVQQPRPIKSGLPARLTQSSRQDGRLYDGPGYCSYEFEINFYNECPMEFCNVSKMSDRNIVCCKRRQLFSLPEICLCHPSRSCDLPDLPEPEDSYSREDDETPRGESDSKGNKTPSDQSDNSSSDTVDDKPDDSSSEKSRDSSIERADDSSIEKSDKKKDDKAGKKSGRKSGKTRGKKNKKSSKKPKDNNNDDEDDKDSTPTSLCAGRLRLLNADKVKDPCKYKGIAQLTRVDDKGDALVCNAVYTIAQIGGSVQRTFLTPQACGILTRDKTQDLRLELQVGDQKYPVQPPIFSTAEGPNGNWYIKIASRYANLFRDLGSCQSNACPYDPGAMRGKVDFNDCKAVSYGATDAATFTTDGLYETSIAFYPGGCLNQKDFFGADNTLCFRTLDEENAYCANDAGAPVYCRSPSTKEWILLGVLAFQNKCDTQAELKVIPFPL